MNFSPKRVRYDGSMNGEAGGGGGGNLPEIELIIKASAIDGKRKGADIFCHVRTLRTYINITYILD